jgi:2-hydroxy-3-keto-5-methylthiopentenyl-1-phosphate phosphatase
MPAVKKTKTLVQSDFDGTITEEDVSFLILDAFADGDWRKLLEEYKVGKITVGSFNKSAFDMVKEDKETLQEFVKKKVRIREGLPELLKFCRSNNLRFVVVSNGLEFYINTIFTDLGFNDIEIYAAQAAFGPGGIQAGYFGPDGIELQNDFKKTYIRRFQQDNYRVLYIGNGASDVPSARLADHIFATDTMLAACRRMNLDCTPFTSLNDIVGGMKHLAQLGL